jgi:hypothetical protein
MAYTVRNGRSELLLPVTAPLQLRECSLWGPAGSVMRRGLAPRRRGPSGLVGGRPGLDGGKPFPIVGMAAIVGENPTI